MGLKAKVDATDVLDDYNTLDYLNVLDDADFCTILSF